MICPCCGNPCNDIRRLVDYTLKGPVERRLAHVFVDNRGEWLSSKQLVKLVYGDRWDGGPKAADEVIDRTFTVIRDKLLPLGVSFESKIGGEGGRRLSP